MTDPSPGGCDLGQAWYLETPNGHLHRLAVGEYSYETNGLLSYEASIRDRAVWSKIDYAEGSFWVATGAADVVGYEKQVQVIDRFDTWCSQPGSCTPVTQQMSGEVQKIAIGSYRLASCFQNAYEVTSVVAARGARYYKVALTAVEKGASKPRLPQSGFIPVRNRDGSHTGTFYPRGC